MTVTERAPLAVLAGDPHPETLRGDRRQGERLGGRPVERQRPGRHLHAVLQKLPDLRMRLEAVGQGHEPHQQVLENVATHAGVHLGGVFFAAADVKGPHAADVVLVDVFLALGDGEIGRQFCLLLLCDLLGFVSRHLAEFEEPLEIALVGARPLLDHAVQRRLGERRLVGLVVAPAAEAIHVDDHVPLKLPAKVHR